MSVFKHGNRWYVRYRHGGTEYRVAGGRTKTDAKEKEIRIKAELQAGADPLSLTASRSFVELATAYLQDPDVKKLAWYSRVKTIATRLTVFFNALHISAINLTAIARYKTKRLEEGIVQSTLNRELAVLRRMLRWGSEHGFVHHSRVPRIRLAKEDPKIIWLSRDDEVTLLAACPDWLKSLVIVGVDTGCRLGELLDLRWRDLDMRAGTLKVSTEKGGGSRQLYMTPRVRALFEALPRGLPDVYVFQYVQGKYRVNTVGQAVRRAVTAAKLSEQLSFHALRHTFATRQVEMGTNILVLKELLGHRSLAMVARYGHVSEADKRRAMLGPETSGKEQPGVREPDRVGYKTGYKDDPEVVQR